MLEEAFTFGLRLGDWKYIAPQRRSATQDLLNNKAAEPVLSDEAQLFNPKNDAGENEDLHALYRIFRKKWSRR